MFDYSSAAPQVNSGSNGSISVPPSPSGIPRDFASASNALATGAAVVSSSLEPNRVKFLAAGAVDALIAAMKVNGQNEIIIRFGCEAMYFLYVGDNESVVVGVASAGIDVFFFAAATF